MKKLIVSVVVTTALFLLDQMCLQRMFATGAPIKIGVIDLQKIMQKSSQVAAISRQLEKRFKPRQQTILAARKSLQEEAEKLHRNASVMSEATVLNCKIELLLIEQIFKVQKFLFNKKSMPHKTKKHKNLCKN